MSYLIALLMFVAIYATGSYAGNLVMMSLSWTTGDRMAAKRLTDKAANDLFVAAIAWSLIYLLS